MPPISYKLCIEACRTQISKNIFRLRLEASIGHPVGRSVCHQHRIVTLACPIFNMKSKMAVSNMMRQYICLGLLSLKNQRQKQISSW